MSAKTGFLLGLILSLLPTPAVAQGSIEPLQHFQAGAVVSSGFRAGSLAYFHAYIPTYPPQPYILKFLRSDGTREGTFSIDPAPIHVVESLGNLLLYISKTSTEDHGLWRTDGTMAGTVPVTQELIFALGNVVDPEVPLTLTFPEKNLVFFSASPRSGSPDFEIWATDGTAEGTRLIKDVNPAGSSNPRRMTLFGGRLFFLADTPQGRELWASDGTPEGTERVHDFHENSSGKIELMQAGGALFLLENLGTGMQIWRSDGTEAGTEQVLTLPERVYARKAAGRHLFLILWGTQGHEIWAVDGGTGEAVRVLQAHPIQEILPLVVGERLAFYLSFNLVNEPWWSDGTPEGTHRIDICPGPCNSFQFAGTYRGRAVVFADDGVSGVEPWLTDGTAAGTWRLGDFCPGECSSSGSASEINGWLVLALGDVWVSDGTPDAAWKVGQVFGGAALRLPGRLLFYESSIGSMSALPVTAPAPLQGAWLESSRVPGFRFKVQIDGQTLGRQEPACMAQTLCVSGALPGRSEVFLRVSNGIPTVVKLTTSAVDVWIVHTATGRLRHYRLNAAEPTGSTLPGLIDRTGFQNTPAAAVGEAKKPRTPQPPGRWIESKTVAGFRVQARLTENGKTRILSKVPCNLAETFCLSGATAGVPDLLVRVTGPKPNGFYWPMVARFAPVTYEVWIQQRKTGQIRYYKLNAPPAGSPQLDGFFDRQGFKK